MLVAILLFSLFLASCATATTNISTIPDASVERFVQEEALTILREAEQIRPATTYKFLLTDKTVGASAGNGEIYVNYTIAQRATKDMGMRWFLRLILAHEIAHDVSGHRVNKQALTALLSGTSLVGKAISYAPGMIGLAGSLASLALGLATRGGYELYSRSAELEADRKGIEYFKKLGYECRVWTRIFRRLLERGATGDFHHPTEERLTQALDLCLSPDHPERVATEKWLTERWELEQKKREEERRLER